MAPLLSFFATPYCSGFAVSRRFCSGSAAGPSNSRYNQPSHPASAAFVHSRATSFFHFSSLALLSFLDQFHRRSAISTAATLLLFLCQPLMLGVRRCCSRFIERCRQRPDQFRSARITTLEVENLLLFTTTSSKWRKGKETHMYILNYVSLYQDYERF